jgi:hypothetical protein
MLLLLLILIEVSAYGAAYYSSDSLREMAESLERVVI